MKLLESLNAWARRIKQDAMALWFACRRPDTPWLVKGLALVVVAYALSPIDLIPDFIPVLGYLDDALVLPALIGLAVRLMPPAVMAHSRAQAQAWMAERGRRPTSYVGAGVVVVLWLLAACGAWLWVQAARA